MRNHPNIKAFVRENTWNVALNGELFYVKSNRGSRHVNIASTKVRCRTNKPESLVNGGNFRHEFHVCCSRAWRNRNPFALREEKAQS